MEREFIVVEGQTQGRPWYSVILIEDGVVKGGDHHWLFKASALQARDAYLAGEPHPLPLEGRV